MFNFQELLNGLSVNVQLEKLDDKHCDHIIDNDEYNTMFKMNLPHVPCYKTIPESTNSESVLVHGPRPYRGTNLWCIHKDGSTKIYTDEYWPIFPLHEPWWNHKLMIQWNDYIDGFFISDDVILTFNTDTKTMCLMVDGDYESLESKMEDGKYTVQINKNIIHIYSNKIEFTIDNRYWAWNGTTLKESVQIIRNQICKSIKSKKEAHKQCQHKVITGSQYCGIHARQKICIDYI